MDAQLRRYAASRRTEGGAASYASKYDRQRHKRLSSRLERRCLRRLLRTSGLAGARVLDAPCGAGRLTPCLGPVAGQVVALDYSPTMLAALGERLALPRLLGDALRLPFADESFELVLSARLSHHIGEESGRLAHLREVMRVASRFAIVTVFDTWSLKNVLRRVRRPLDGKRPKYTLTRAQVRAAAAASGFRVRRALPLSRLASGHVYYLLERHAVRGRA